MSLLNGALYSDHSGAAAVTAVCLWTGVVVCVKMWLIGVFKLLWVEAEATTTRSVVSDSVHQMRHDSFNHELTHTGNLECLWSPFADHLSRGVLADGVTPVER